MAELINQQFKHVVPVIRSKSGWTVPKFSDCAVDLLALSAKSVEVMCCLSDNKLMITTVNDSKHLSSPNISSAEFEKFGPLILEHPAVCPISELAKTSNPDGTYPPNKLYVAVAVALILESTDAHVLLTKRASTMRSYPGVWVPPGGHLDKGETLLECGLRELKEETGINLEPSEIKSNYICMWEGVSPPMLNFGNPKSHSLVVYIHVQAPYTWEEMQAKINIDQQEVQAWCWFNRTIIQQLTLSEDLFINMYRPGDSPGEHKEVQTNLKTMFRTPYLWATGMFYSGTQAALILWSRKSSKL